MTGTFTLQSNRECARCEDAGNTRVKPTLLESMDWTSKRVNCVIEASPSKLSLTIRKLRDVLQSLVDNVVPKARRASRAVRGPAVHHARRGKSWCYDRRPSRRRMAVSTSTNEPQLAPSFRAFVFPFISVVARKILLAREIVNTVIGTLTERASQKIWRVL